MRRWRGAALAAGAILTLVALHYTPAAAQDGGGRQLQASAQLEPAVAGLDELITFSITVEASGFSGLSITPKFELDNLDIAAGPFQSRSQRWVNGDTSNSVQLTWRLRARAVGPQQVRAIRVITTEQTLELADRQVDIQKAAPPGRAAPPTSRSPSGVDPFEDFFARAFPDPRRERVERRAPERSPKLALKAEITPSEIFVGQQATYTLWLYTQSDISAFQPTKIPDFQGFWVREIPQPQELKPEWVDMDGERFGRVPMLRRAVFPLKDGTFSIEPTEADVVARVADFGPFGSPFGRNESLHLKTDPVSLTARPLPATTGGAPFSGPVGEVALSARFDRTAIDVGQAATLTVRCTGRGNLQSLAPPRLELPPGVRGFPPRQDASERLTDGVLVASTEWTYVLVPERPGSFSIGGVSIPYFDPAKREYRVASAAPPPLAVTGTAVGDVAATSHPAAAVAPAKAASAAAPATEGASLRNWPRRVWIPAAAAGGVGLLSLVLLSRRGAGSAASGGGKGGSARALKSAIAQAGQGGGNPRQAAAELEEAWRQHLAARWNIPPGTPVSSWADRLVAQRADSAAAHRLSELAHELQYLRYAPELSAADHLLADALDASKRLVRPLR